MIIQQTKAEIRICRVGGLDHVLPSGDAAYHITEWRVYEDICKPYLTGQLVIETLVNLSEEFIYPTAEVFLEWECPRSDGGPTRVYSERMRVFSYDSRPIGGGTDVRMQHTLSLIGQEYYNDRHNIVVQRIKNQTATSAAASIHEQYMKDRGPTGGSMQVSPGSTGLIGKDDIQHAATNKKPMKAIHDLLDRAVYAAWPSCAPVYFRRQAINGKSTYVMSPLQKIMEDGSVYKYFHKPASSSRTPDNLIGYDLVIHFKPIVPPSEHGQAVAGALGSLLTSTSHFNYKSKQFGTVKPNLGNALSQFTGNAQLKAKVQSAVAEAQRGTLGSSVMMGLIDELMQSASVDKNGPGGYRAKQEAFLTAVAYSRKYWVSVPGQSGLNVSAGDVIEVEYYINGDTPLTKRLFIPRLIHEVRFTRNDDRSPVNNQAVTEIYGVEWN